MSLIVSPWNLEMDTWPHGHKLTDKKKWLFMYAVCIHVYIWTHDLSEAARGV